MRVCFYTLGCKVNLNETGALEQMFRGAGFTIVPEGEEADVFVVNSCTVTNFGDQKSRKWLRRKKRENPGAVTVLTGCYPQAFPEEAAQFTEADLVCGNGDRKAILENVQKLLDGHERIVAIAPHQRGEQFEQQSVLKDLFLMGTSDNYGDMLTTMTAMSGFEPVGENGAYPADGMQEGYRKLLVYDTWKDSFAISAEMIEDSKLMDLKKQPAAFLTGYNRTREMFGAALLGNAIRGNAAAQYHGKSFDINAADGVTLFHTAHPPKVAGDNQCNSFKDEFSVDALGKLETAMHLFRGDNDEILDVAPDTIVIPENADLKKAVFAAIGADKDPVTANNAFNYQYGRWTVIVWSYLNQFITAGTKPWLLLDSKYNKTYGGAVWNDRIQLAVRSTIDENTDANVWRGRSRFNATFNDWRAFAAGGIASGNELP